MQQPDDDRPRPQEEPDEAPETPTDEPLPVPVQDPPAEPRPLLMLCGLARAGRQD